MPGDPLANSLGHVESTLRRCLGEHQYELVTSVARDEIRLSDRTRDHLRYLGQGRAPRPMAVSIIDHLEAIQVHENHRYGRPISPGTPNLAFKRLIEVADIVKPREVVYQRLPRGVVIIDGVGERTRKRGANQLDHRGFVMRERIAFAAFSSRLDRAYQPAVRDQRNA